MVFMFPLRFIEKKYFTVRVRVGLGSQKRQLSAERDLGAFTRQSKNGTDPTKTGTVPIVFAKK